MPRFRVHRFSAEEAEHVKRRLDNQDSEPAFAPIDGEGYCEFCMQSQAHDISFFAAKDRLVCSVCPEIGLH